jgi:hypothetical protein
VPSDVQQFLELAALTIFVVSVTGFLIAGVIHVAVSSRPTPRLRPDTPAQRPRQGSDTR